MREKSSRKKLKMVTKSEKKFQKMLFDLQNSDSENEKDKNLEESEIQRKDSARLQLNQMINLDGLKENSENDEPSQKNQDSLEKKDSSEKNDTKTRENGNDTDLKNNSTGVLDLINKEIGGDNSESSDEEEDEEDDDLENIDLDENIKIDENWA